MAAMLLGATNSFAQQGERVKLLSNEEFFSKSDYIIEAKSAGIKPTAYDVGGNYNPDDFYTSAFMIVTYIYKNDNTMSLSPGDTINLTVKGGTILKPLKDNPLDMEKITSPLREDYDTGERGSVFMTDDSQSIFFMKKSDFPENPDTSKRNKHPKVSMLQDVKRASINIWGKVTGLNDLHFENRYELYKYMEQFEGVKVPLSDPRKMHWDLFGDDNTFNQYLKERNIKWRPNDRQRIDSLKRFLGMKYQKVFGR
jgi:hypothetical protein